MAYWSCWRLIGAKTWLEEQALSSLPPRLTTIASRKRQGAESISKLLDHLDSPHAGLQASQVGHRTQQRNPSHRGEAWRRFQEQLVQGVRWQKAEQEVPFLRVGWRYIRIESPIHISGSNGVPRPRVTGLVANVSNASLKGFGNIGKCSLSPET